MLVVLVIDAEVSVDVKLTVVELVSEIVIVLVLDTVVEDRDVVDV